jgi:hypothetical protein
MGKIINYGSNPLKAIALLIFLIPISGCGKRHATTAPQMPLTPIPSPTSSPTSTPTSRPTSTPTSMPDLPEGPFVWSGDTRPLLMAHYMPWYQTPAISGYWGYHWTMNHFTPTKDDQKGWQNLASHYTPLTGPYDSSDKAILEYQALLMKLSGIDGVIVDWYGIEDFWDYGTINASTQKLFQTVKKAGLKFVICYEDQTIMHMVDNDHIKKEDALTHGQKVMRYMQDTWFSDDAYLKVNNQPVLFIFGPQYFKSASDWETLFSVLETPPLFITLDNPVIPVAAAGYPWPPMWASQSGVLSHDILLDYLTDFYDKANNWDYVVGGAFPEFNDIYKEAGVSSGYGYLDALNGKTFRFTLQEALDHNPDMIQLITWNDYGEGTIIEPTAEFEYRYLEIVQEARQITSAGGFTYTAEDLRLPLKWYSARVKYAQYAEATTRLEEAFNAIVAGDLEAATEIMASYP